jgi:transcriptional regulator with GAF, ATPase, and Fis domain
VAAKVGAYRPRAATNLDEWTATRPSEVGSGVLIGHSAPVLELRRQIAAVSGSSSAVLIRGETGTGKGLVANLIHTHSPRHRHPMVHLDCTSLASSLVESEFFGHERGAFTGATERRKGRFELAGTGTIFLDEIGDVDPSLQVKLLRVLQDRTYERIGGSETLSMGARVIAATNRDLEQAIEQGRFREDLYYRLKVLEIRVPPLRTRKEDIEPLARHHLERLTADSEGDRAPISSSFFSVLAGHDWPGNVRELHNFLQRAVVLNGSKPLDGATADRLLGEDPRKPSFASQVMTGAAKSGTAHPLEPGPESGRREILEALQATGGNVTQAARLLRVPRSTLRYRIGRIEDRELRPTP